MTSQRSTAFPVRENRSFERPPSASQRDSSAAGEGPARFLRWIVSVLGCAIIVFGQGAAPLSAQGAPTVFYRGHPWCERPVISGASHESGYKYDEEDRTVERNLYRSKDRLLQFLRHEYPGFAGTQGLIYKNLQAAIERHTKAKEWIYQDSPFISVTTNERQAEGYAARWAAKHNKKYGEVLVIRVPANKVCSTARWQRIVIDSKKPVLDESHPVFRECDCFETFNDEEYEWVFLHEIPAKYIKQTKAFPKPNHPVSCEQNGPDEEALNERTKLRGKPASPASIRGGRAAVESQQSTVAFGGVTVDVTQLKNAVIGYLKKQIMEALRAKVDEIKSEFDSQVSGYSQEIYQDFLYWLNEQAKNAGVSEFPIQSLEFERDFLAWVDSPQSQMSQYVEKYLKERSAVVARLIEAYRDQASWQIVDGLKSLWADADEKLTRFTQAELEISAHPDTPYADILGKYGFSGPWIDHFKSYEGRFNAFNERYRVVEAAEIVAGAFQSDLPQDKIAGLFNLLQLMGGVAAESNIPIVSFFGDIIRIYGDVSKEMLAKVNGLKEALRKRQGYCLGAGTTDTDDKRQKAFAAKYGSGDLICPTDLNPDIYERVIPNDGRIFFWIKNGFVEGRENGGGLGGVRETIALIKEAALYRAGYAGKENDIETIARIYNAAYTSEQHGGGIPGLRAEAESVIEGVFKRLHEINEWLGGLGVKSCAGEDPLDLLLKKTAGFNRDKEIDYILGNETPPEPIRDLRAYLKTTYAIDYIDGKRGAYLTNSKRWEKLKLLSFVFVEGEVREGDRAGSCRACRGGKVELAVRNGETFPECRNLEVDEQGRFSALLATRSADLEAEFTALIKDRRSQTETLRQENIGFSGLPFAGVFRPLILRVGADDSDLKPVREIVDALKDLQKRSDRQSDDAAALCEAASARTAEIQNEEAAYQDQIDKFKTSAADLDARAEAAAGKAEGVGRYHAEAEQGTQALGQGTLRAEAVSLELCEALRKVQKARTSAERKRLYAAMEPLQTELKRLLGEGNNQTERVEASGRLAQDAVRDLESLAKEIKKFAPPGGVEKGLAAVVRKLAKNAKEAEAVKIKADEIAALKDRAAALLAEGRKRLRENNPDGERAELFKKWSEEMEALYQRIAEAEARARECSGKVAVDLEQARQRVEVLKGAWERTNATRNKLLSCPALSDSALVKLREKANLADYLIKMAGAYRERLRTASTDGGLCIVLAQDLLNKPIQVVVPNLAGLTVEEAAGVLREQGLIAQPRSLGAAPHPDLEKRIKNQSPAAGAEVKAESGVVLEHYGRFDAAAAVAHTNCSQWPGSQAVWSSQNNRAECACPPGKQWNQAKTACISDRQAALEAVNCAAWPGSVPVWDESTRRAACGCTNGLVWNRDLTMCIDKRQAAVESTDCSRYPGSVPLWNQTAGRVECFCVNGTIWNAGRTACVTDRRAALAAINCTQWPGSVPVWDELNNRPACGCPAGTVPDANGGACISQQEALRRQERELNCLRDETAVLSALNSHNIQLAQNLLNQVLGQGCNIDPFTYQAVQQEISYQQQIRRNQREQQAWNQVLMNFNNIMRQFQNNSNPQSPVPNQPPPGPPPRTGGGTGQGTGAGTSGASQADCDKKFCPVCGVDNVDLLGQSVSSQCMQCRSQYKARIADCMRGGSSANAPNATLQQFRNHYVYECVEKRWNVYTGTYDQYISYQVSGPGKPIPKGQCRPVFGPDTESQCVMRAETWNRKQR